MIYIPQCFRSSSGSIVTVSLPASWSGVQCDRERRVDSAAVFTPDLIIVSDHLQDTEDSDGGDDDDDGSVWTLQHGGCGEQGLLVTASEKFFQPNKDIMKHHEKGTYQSNGNSFRFLRIEIVAL